MFRARLFVIGGLSLAIVNLNRVAPAAGQITYDWSNPLGGPFQGAGNWTPTGGPPTGLDTARFNLNDSYTVTFTADRSHQFFHIGNDDVFLDLSNRTYTLSGDYPTLVAGLASGDAATLTVQNGTLISNWATIGLFWPGEIDLFLPGPITWNNSAAIIVGGTASADAKASGGAQITSGWTVVGGLGGAGGGNGTLRVLDSGTLWNCSANVMAVGADANGTLIVNGGGDVTSGWGDIGVAAGISGDAVVNGAGSRWDMGIGGAALGVNGVGILNVQSGGVVTSRFCEIGVQSSGSGSATISGAGSRFDLSPFGVGVGINGNGALSIQTGGMVSSVGADIGKEVSGDGEVTIAGAGSLWDVNGIITVGMRGEGDLLVNAGGRVEADRILMGRFASATANMVINGEVDIDSDGSYLYVGYEAPSTLTLNGTLTVSDPGGTIGGDDGYTIVGSSSGATGQLTINAGGSFSSSAQLQLGALAGSHGTVTIHAGGSAISRLAASSPSGAAGNVGRDGTGIMNIAGGLWNCLDGALNVGFNAGSNGTMNITNGGSALSIGGSIGRSAGANGTVLIDGAGSDWTSTATLNVGVTGTGSLTVANGGLVAAPTVQIGGNGTAGGIGLFSGTVANDGTLAPGDVPGPADIGLLTINGALTQAPTGKTVVDISGTATGQRDRLQISTSASLSGTLQVNLVGGFIPAPGQEFQIITAGNVSGTFADLSGPGSGYLEAVYDATTVKLRYCQPCDANCDGVSNGRDISPFVNILIGAATPCGTCAGDANRDASISLSDVGAFVQCLTAP